MPRLLVFAPCETVLLGQNESVSLIVMLSEIKLSGVPDPIPEDGVVPMRWYIFSEWEISLDEIGSRFEQRFEMVDANNAARGLTSVAEFSPPPEKRLHRIIGNLTFFPLLPGGDYRLHLSIRRIGEEEWSQVGDYPLRIITEAAAQG